MRIDTAALVAAAMLASSVAQSRAQESVTTGVEARGLSVAVLLAMAAAERASPGAYSCCDWGGMGCIRPVSDTPPAAE